MSTNIAGAEKVFYETLLDYEAWADGEWLSSLDRFEDRGEAAEILVHITGGYEAWLKLFGEEFDEEFKGLDLGAQIDDYLRRWRLILRSHELDQEVDITVGKGVRRKISVREILHHVLNHGTYHRGRLRGLAESLGIKDFPETDSMTYFISLRDRG